MKKIISLILSIVLLAGILPAGALALNPASAEKSEGYSVSSLSFDGKTATADIVNPGACKLVVAVYDPDSGKMLGSGITALEKNAGTAQAMIDIPAMPQYFLARAFLLDGNMGALCPKYESRLYTKAFENYRKVTLSVCSSQGESTVLIPDAEVTAKDGFCDCEGDGRYDDRTAVTDGNGEAVFYFEPGEHAVTATAEGYFQTTATFTVAENAKSFTIKLMKDSGSGSEPGDNTSDGTGSDDGWVDRTHYKLGSFPQTDVTESMGSILDSEATAWKSYRYYSGTGKSDVGSMTAGDFMLYCDVTYGEDKYRGVTFSTYRPTSTNYESSASTYNFQDDNGYTCGNIYWFRYEPVIWRVRDSQTGLAICETIIDSRPLTEYAIRNKSDRQYYNDKGALANDWETSSLKAWLNNEFLQMTFTEDQQDLIKINDTGGGNEKVFLLPEKYATNPVYFPSNSARQAQGSDYAKCQGLHVQDGYSEWRLTSPGYDSYFTCGVTNEGNITEQCGANTTCAGVRPAIKLNLSDLPSRPNKSKKAAAPTGVFDYSYDNCKPDNDYILLNVTGYKDGFALTQENLEYIDLITADSSGSVSGAFTPRNAITGSTTLLIGDFGSGTQAVKLTALEGVTGQINIVNYYSSISVDYKSKLVFHTDMQAPDGFVIVWSTGDTGPECTIGKAEKSEYRIKADLVRTADNTVVASTWEEVVKVDTRFFAKLVAFFRGLFGTLPVYEDNNRK